MHIIIGCLSWLITIHHRHLNFNKQLWSLRHHCRPEMEPDEQFGSGRVGSRVSVMKLLGTICEFWVCKIWLVLGLVWVWVRVRSEIRTYFSKTPNNNVHCSHKWQLSVIDCYLVTQFHLCCSHICSYKCHSATTSGSGPWSLQLARFHLCCRQLHRPVRPHDTVQTIDSEPSIPLPLNGHMLVKTLTFWPENCKFAEFLPLQAVYKISCT